MRIRVLVVRPSPEQNLHSIALYLAHSATPTAPRRESPSRANLPVARADALPGAHTRSEAHRGLPTSAPAAFPEPFAARTVTRRCWYSPHILASRSPTPRQTASTTQHNLRLTPTNGFPTPATRDTDFEFRPKRAISLDSPYDLSAKRTGTARKHGGRTLHHPAPHLCRLEALRARTRRGIANLVAGGHQGARFGEFRLWRAQTTADDLRARFQRLQDLPPCARNTSSAARRR